MSKNNNLIETFKKSLSITLKSIGKKEDIEIKFVADSSREESLALRRTCVVIGNVDLVATALPTTARLRANLSWDTLNFIF